MFASPFPRPAPQGLPFTRGRRARAWIACAAASLAREIRIRRDLRIVSGLDDAMLRDIGIARGGLEGAVRFGRAREQPEDRPHAGTGCRTGRASMSRTRRDF